LELEEEAEERRKQETDPAKFMKKLRAKKLEELVNLRNERLLSNAKRDKEAAPTLKAMEKVEEGVTLGKVEEGTMMQKVEEGITHGYDDVGLDMDS